MPLNFVFFFLVSGSPKSSLPRKALALAKWWCHWHPSCCRPAILIL